jgi:NADH-quinone oxidoreductase subunit E
MDVHEVASFYSMFETEKIGKHTISVCTNVSCMLNGSDEILNHLEKKLKIKVGESTDMFFLKDERECLAACGGAPMMQVDHKYYENLNKEKIDKIIEDIEND